MKRCAGNAHAAVAPWVAVFSGGLTQHIDSPRDSLVDFLGGVCNVTMAWYVVRGAGRADDIWSDICCVRLEYYLRQG